MTYFGTFNEKRKNFGGKHLLGQEKKSLVKWLKPHNAEVHLYNLLEQEKYSKLVKWSKPYPKEFPIYGSYNIKDKKISKFGSQFFHILCLISWPLRKTIPTLEVTLS